MQYVKWQLLWNLLPVYVHNTASVQKTRGILLSSFLQAIVSIAIGCGSGWVSYSFASDSKHFLCLPSSLPLPHSIHCECQVTKCQPLCHPGLRKSPGACCNANPSGDAWSPFCWVKRLKENTSQEKGKSAVSSAFHLCLNDKMGEELSSIWTGLIVAGLSAELQEKRFSSSVGEEKHVYHNSLGLLCAGRGFWIETLGWWGVSGGSYLSWYPDIPVKTTDKKITALHCNMPWWCSKSALGGSQLKTWASQFLLPKLWAKHDLHPKPSCANVLHAFRSWSVRIYPTRHWDNMTNLHLQLDLTNSTNSSSM